MKRWKRSGLTAREFGKREGFSGEQLTWWKWHLNRRGAPKPRVARRRRPPKARPAAPVQFVEVKLPTEPVAPEAREASIEIVLGNGRTVRVPPGCSGTWLASVLAAADGGAPC